MLYDTHTHLNDHAFDADRETLIAALPEGGVGLCNVVGWDMASSRAAVALAGKYPSTLRSIVGVSPQEAMAPDAAWLNELRALAGDTTCVAIGEIGLDYHWDTHPRDVQMACLEAQTALAQELGLPLVYHVRDAWGDFLPYLARCHVAHGVMHCFTGSVESAKTCLDAGLYISFAGPVSFKNARKLVDVAKYVPEDRLLIETDCPYLSPEPLRGRRNEPAHLRFTAEALAAHRGVSEEALGQSTWDNAQRIFSIRD